MVLDTGPVCARDAADPSEFIRTTTVDTCDIAHDAVRGNAVMYQHGSTDAFGDFPSTSIDETYGDVVSVTSGSPRNHVFSWVFGFKAGGTDDSNCPAIGGASPPGWVGSDYLCATGNPSASTNERIWYPTPLFGADCSRPASHRPPLPTSTSGSSVHMTPATRTSESRPSGCRSADPSCSTSALAESGRTLQGRPDRRVEDEQPTEVTAPPRQPIAAGEPERGRVLMTMYRNGGRCGRHGSTQRNAANCSR